MKGDIINDEIVEMLVDNFFDIYDGSLIKLSMYMAFLKTKGQKFLTDPEIEKIYHKIMHRIIK